MFGLGFTEIMVILVVVIVFVKPEDLPGFLKGLGKSYGELKKTANEAKKMKDDFVKLAETDIKKAAVDHTQKLLTESTDS